MSSKASLSAAKARRTRQTAPAVDKRNVKNVPPPPPSQIIQQTNQTAGMNPLQIISQHDKRLFNLEQGFNEMAENINGLNGYVSNENEEETVAFFKARYESVEKELSDVKQLLIKIQSFAMETNLDLMRFKKTLCNETSVDNCESADNCESTDNCEETSES